MPDIENGQGPTDVDPERVGTPRGFLDQALDLVGERGDGGGGDILGQLASLPEAGERLNRTADSLGMEGLVGDAIAVARGAHEQRVAEYRVVARGGLATALREILIPDLLGERPEELRPGLLLELFAGRIPVEEVTEHSLLELDSRRGGDSGESASELCPDAEGRTHPLLEGGRIIERLQEPIDLTLDDGAGGDITADLQEGETRERRGSGGTRKIGDVDRHRDGWRRPVVDQPACRQLQLLVHAGEAEGREAGGSRCRV